jgi:hypothetical protein
MADDRFEDRLRAFAQQLSRSISEIDLDEVADRLRVDRDRVQGAADAVEGWLSDRAAAHEPLFGEGTDATRVDPESLLGDRSADPMPHHEAHHEARPAPAGRGGPHPLDVPTDEQGRALSALSSGRWTVRPGSGRLSSIEPAPSYPEPPGHSDLTGELRARDWITADGAVTLVGRQALLRWCSAQDGEPSEPEGDGRDA